MSTIENLETKYVINGMVRSVIVIVGMFRSGVSATSIAILPRKSYDKRVAAANAREATKKDLIFFFLPPPARPSLLGYFHSAEYISKNTLSKSIPPHGLSSSTDILRHAQSENEAAKAAHCLKYLVASRTLLWL